MSKGLEALKTIRHIHDMECEPDKSINKDFDIIEKELEAKDFVFDKLSIKVREIHYKDGTIKYQLCFNFIYAIEITKEEYDLLREILL